jgi:outer membrane protein OmpA-like peptidoglycan-associated protein
MLLVSGLAACTAPGASNTDASRYLVYFDEFSANLSPEAVAVVADAAKDARESGARAIRVEARASATGTPETNRRLAETRSSIVADQLQADGISRSMIQQVPIGQTGSNDPTVTERRVDIILQH